MRLVAALLLTFAIGCGSDKTTNDMSIVHCNPTPQQGGTCNPMVDMPCISPSGLMCSCQCLRTWICGDTITCDDLSLPVHDLAHMHD